MHVCLCRAEVAHLMSIIPYKRYFANLQNMYYNIQTRQMNPMIIYNKPRVRVAYAVLYTCFELLLYIPYTIN